MLRPFLLLAISCALLAAPAGAPDRKVEGNVILSTHDPAVRVALPKSVQYLGADRWDLYDVADCEVEVFVDADTNRNVRHLYWVQFEGYLSTKPDLKHEYDSPQHTTIGGWDFFVDTWVRANDAATRAGSDREHVQALIAKKGYKMPAGMMYVRLVHLLDESTRKELMIIYGEDLAAAGFSAADLSPGGKAYDRWPGIARELVERARQGINVNPGAKP